MDGDNHKRSLYRWKRQEEPRSYSRSQKVTSHDDISDWIKKVEEASNRAAEETFGINHSSGRRRGKSSVKAAREFTQTDQDAHSEAQDLLSQWMDEKVNLHAHLDPEIDATFDDDSWQRHEIQSDVKREWDNLLANNLDDYEIPLASQRSSSRTKNDLYLLDEEDAVAMVMENMMGKQLVKKEFKKDLGLNKWDKQTDPKTKMELRQRQVKENREKREEELRRRREQQQNKKEAMHRAKTLVMNEERVKELSTKKEEMAIRKEMTKIRKEMQEERRQVEEKKAKQRLAKEDTLLAAKSKVATDERREQEQGLEEERRREDRERLLLQRVKELEAREVANNLKILHRHFSAWYNVVLDRRLKMGKARAMADWKLILHAWNAWRSFVRDRRVEVETKHHELEAIHTHRNQQKAVQHSRLKLLRKYYIAWQVWARGEQERRELEQAQSYTRNKMMSLLEAAASGKLSHHDDASSVQSSARGGSRQREAPSTADRIHAMFNDNTRRPKQLTESLASSRSDVSTATTSTGKTAPSRVPTQAWQVTKKHLDLTAEELAEIGDGEPTCSPEEMNAKVLKKYGRQPWHKLEVSSYEHRHNTQKRILDEQKHQIHEQQRLIEELQFKSTHMELQKQLVEQKLVLQNLVQQVPDGGSGRTDNKGTEAKNDNNNNSNRTHKSSHGGQKVATNKRPSSASVLKKSTSAPKSEASTQRSDKSITSRTDASHTDSQQQQPSTARTDVSRPSSYTSTASEQSKYLQVMKKMEDRHAERARLKAEREEKKRLAEEQRLAELEAIEAERKKEEEEEKRAKVEAFREKKRLEKQREAERLLREERTRVHNEMADQHYQKSILKYRGLVPMKKLVAMAKEHESSAVKHYNDTLQRNTLRAWHTYVKDLWREREALADEMSNFLCVKHCFQNWRVYKHHMIILEHRAVKHFQLMKKTKVFQAWRDYANEEKVASWEKERRAREHYKMLLLRRHFRAWYRLPDEIEKERERERRREELRQKVAALLPDFETVKSIDQSTDFVS